MTVNVSMQDLLQPIALTKVISQMAAVQPTLLNMFGFEPGGKSELDMGLGRQGYYHVYNNVRKVALGRAPGTAHARSPANPMGKVPFVFPRMADSLVLPMEELNNIAKIGDPALRDKAGIDYISRQSKTLAQKAANWRLAMTVGMLRDSLYMDYDGESTYLNYGGQGMRLSFGRPVGNTGKLDMVGDGNIIDVSWATTPAEIATCANIPFHLAAINAAFQQLNGGSLTDVICSAKTWMYVIENAYVAKMHGISVSPFRRFEKQIGTGPDGRPLNEHAGELAVMPGVVWHITDAGLELGAPGAETFQKHVPDGYAIFLCGPEQFDDLYTMHIGGEPVAERDGAPITEKRGFSAWSNQTSNPTATNLFVLDNCLPTCHVPNAIAYGQVVFT
jgi:hypothetical protein